MVSLSIKEGKADGLAMTTFVAECFFARDAINLALHVGL